MNPVDVDAAGFDLLIGGQRGSLSDDVNLDALIGQLLGEFVDVRADASDDSGRVFPGEHHDPHWRFRVLSSEERTAMLRG